jgi:hypothetical protein
MPCDEQINKLLYKHFQNVSDVDTNRPYYSEPFASYPIIHPNRSIWAQASSIPATAPVVADNVITGVVQFRENVLMTAVAGAPNSFYHADLVNAIPFNFDSTGWTYMPIIKDGTLATTYKFTESDWLINSSSGTLTFYKNKPAVLTASGPPRVSFYRYIGLMGVVAPATPLGMPTSGTFSYNLKMEQTLTLADSMQLIDLLVSEFTEAPKDLSDITLSLADTTYQARLADGSPGTIVTTVQHATNQPTTAVTAPSLYGNDGTIVAYIDGVAVGSADMTLVPDSSGTYTSLVIDSDYDPFTSTNSPGIYNACTMHVAPSVALTPSLTPITFQIKQENLVRNSIAIPSRDTNVLTFTLNDIISPLLFSQSITAVGGGTTNVSGVPRLTAGQNLTVTFTASGVVGKVFHQTRVAVVESTYTSSVNVQPASATDLQTLTGLTGTVTLNAGTYHANLPIDITGYSADDTASATVQAVTAAGLEVDTNASSLLESTVRLQSGIGQFGTGGNFGLAFNSATSLATNEELQMTNGKFHYPAAVNYSLTLTGGPDYSALAASSYGGLRWVTFNLGAVSSTTTSTVVLNFNSTENWPATTMWATTAGVANEVDVYLTDGTGVWIAGNVAYDPFSTVTNGVGGVVVHESTPTTRVITRGTTSFTGNLYARVGIKSTSSAKLSTVTLTTLTKNAFSHSHE